MFILNELWSYRWPNYSDLDVNDEMEYEKLLRIIDK